MKEQFLAKINEVQVTDVVLSYGGDADTRISPRVITAVFRFLETVMYYPPIHVPE
jgi:hypothetical protein